MRLQDYPFVRALRKVVKQVKPEAWPTIYAELKKIPQHYLSKRTDILPGAFVWAATPQKYNYWRNIDRRYPTHPKA